MNDPTTTALVALGLNIIAWSILLFLFALSVRSAVDKVAAFFWLLVLATMVAISIVGFASFAQA